ncbi:hypothetical protein EUTSA_v10011978mg [Eutrema salsugineum]|uniref:Retrotransposon Copia-like N-terminal domain-containing protein n=1 Tax=Eutrema salsugineum TaxID=72664 RepID=V4MGU9_EUTSA|nr:hypothetical protein EUTSA_v10011978mg [Eutrema salsugineum]
MTGGDGKIIEQVKTLLLAYQFAANENPGAIIAHVHFNGDNFAEWAQAIRMTMKVKKKYGFVDGTVVKPKEDATEYEDWIMESIAISPLFLDNLYCSAELAQLRQGNISVIDYFGMLHVLLEDLTNYEPAPACKCGGCTCSLVCRSTA